MITITGRITNPVSGDQDNSLPKVRAKQKQMTTTIPNAVISHTNVGVLMSDAYHYSIATNGMVEKLRRAGKSFAFASGASGYKGSGAQTLTGTRAAAVITMPITANGATSYSALSGLDSVTAASGAALTSWQVSADDFVTFLTITSVALSGTNVVLTLAATPAGAVKVRNHQGKSPDVSSWVFGTYADAFKIALEPLFIPITVT